MRISRLAPVLLLAWCALAQEAPPVLRGRWTATVGAEVLRGTWTSQASPDKPNDVQGSWTLLSGAGEPVGEGTWSAQKTRRGWVGSWTARTLRGKAMSGTWTAEITDLAGKSLRDMLQATASQQIAGAWRSGGYSGNWWLKSRTPSPR